MAGDHVVHVGTGTGYYTAILSHLVGPSGRITGIEYEPELAVRAKANFATYPNVEIVQGETARGFRSMRPMSSTSMQAARDRPIFGSTASPRAGG
jgi:protein-L-isoaspartate(D-aspartate) O-methyltransferase